MVYYQSTPLIVKTEQPSQVQFCTPPPSSSSTSSSNTTKNVHQHFSLQQQKTQNYVALNSACVDIVPTSSQSQLQQQQQSITGTKLHNLTNIKLELLPPGLTLFTTSAPPNSTTTLTAIANTTTSTSPNIPSLTTLPNVAATTTTTTTAKATTTRKSNNNGINKPQFKCEQCGMTFGSKSAHTSHTKSHAKNNVLGIGGVGALESGNSQMSAPTTSAIEVNEAGVPLGIPKMPQIKPFANGLTVGDPYQCNVCQKTFAVPARLIRHYRTHTGERPFECEFCHKLFSVKENLQVHRRIHTKERPYKCDVCGRAFEHSGKLHRHMRIHTGERPHKCNVCEKTFIQSGQLVIHMRTHTGEKPYKCPVEGCGKGFTCSKQLKVHSRTHTGEKPYHCDICFRDFGYNHVLKLHRVQHYGSKCYKCTICDETFKSKKEMEAHIKGHANELPEEEEGVGASTTASTSSNSSSASVSGGETTSSGPGSPQSPNRIAKPRKPKSKAASSTANTSPPSPSSPRSTLSPPSSMASVSRMSAGSPFELYSSQHHETDQYSRDSGLASSGTSVNGNRTSLPTSTLDLSHYTQKQQHQQEEPQPITYNTEEMPTDLSIQHQNSAHSIPPPISYYQQQVPQNEIYQYQEALPTSSNYIRLSPTLTYRQRTPSPPALQPAPAQDHQHHVQMEAPTINPALLEAASIASRRAMLGDPREEDVTQAALQIMQLHRSQQTVQIQPLTMPQEGLQTVSALSPSQQTLLAASDTSQYDDTREANELIEHYKRGELARHGIHKRYAPVPKFESSFLNNEIIVRQVEAAIAPLRSSTESPERSSSPESDSMMMADRDVMTLPLRKRKLYMKGGVNTATPSPTPLTAPANVEVGVGNEPKVMRMSSVIQFAKAS